MADAFLTTGDQLYQDGSASEGDQLVGYARTIVDTVAGFTPGVSMGTDLFQLNYGYNPWTNEPVSEIEKGVIVASLVMPSAVSGSAKLAMKFGKFLKRLSDNPAAQKMVGWLKNRIRRVSLLLEKRHA